MGKIVKAAFAKIKTPAGGAAPTKKAVVGSTVVRKKPVGRRSGMRRVY